MKCEYCSLNAEHYIEPYPNAGYKQHLCQKHWDKGEEMRQE
jgi:hypothetical protein